MSSRPKVSVYLVTYNHVQFISQALDSVLMQQTQFDYEIIVGDDASTDGTTEIIREYQKRWPDKIKPIFRTKNVGPGRNTVETFEQCRGDYIACLDGDDYWTDPKKLQLQVDYLDQKIDCALVHHGVEHIAWPGRTTLGRFPAGSLRREHQDSRNLAMVNYIQTCSVMFRRKWLPVLDEQYLNLKLGDWPLFVLLSQSGCIGFIDREMANYRIHSHNNWNNRPPDYKIRAMEGMAFYLLDRVNEESKAWWKDTILALTFKDLFLSIKSLSLRKSIGKFIQFVRRSIEFKRPLWLFDSLWIYYRINSLAKASQ